MPPIILHSYSRAVILNYNINYIITYYYEIQHIIKKLSNEKSPKYDLTTIIKLKISHQLQLYVHGSIV